MFYVSNFSVRSDHRRIAVDPSSPSARRYISSVSVNEYGANICLRSVAFIIIECGGRNIDALAGRVKRGRYIQWALSEL